MSSLSVPSFVSGLAAGVIVAAAFIYTKRRADERKAKRTSKSGGDEAAAAAPAAAASSSASTGLCTAERPLRHRGDKLKMVLCVRNDLGMGKGKGMAQCCHAAVGVVQEMLEREETAAVVEDWDYNGAMKVTPTHESNETAETEEPRVTSILNSLLCSARAAAHRSLSKSTRRRSCQTNKQHAACESHVTQSVTHSLLFSCFSLSFPVTHWLPRPRLLVCPTTSCTTQATLRSRRTRRRCWPSDRRRPQHSIS